MTSNACELPHENCYCQCSCYERGKEAALADTLGMLEEIARQEWVATLETGDEEHFKVRVQQNPDRTAGGFRYWIAEPGERLGEETTRAEVLVLLKGDAE